MNVNQKMRAAREAQPEKLSVADVAKLTGVPRSTMRAYEVGQIEKVPASVIRTLSSAWNIPYEWFWDGSDTPPPTRRTVEVVSRRMGAEIGNLFQLLPVWRGTSAGLEDECVITEDGDDPLRVPSLLIVESGARHVAVTVSGLSMSPRIEIGDYAVVRLDDAMRLNTLSILRSPDGTNYFKVVRKTATGLRIESINPAFPPIEDVAGWAYRGYCIAIIHQYQPGMSNLEWDEGRPLRA